MTRPPRLVARTLAATFLTVAAILGVVFTSLILDTRDRVRTAETEKLQVGEQVFTALEGARQREKLATIATLAENPTLKAALDTYFTESQFSGADVQSLRDTVTVEAGKLAGMTQADVVAVADTRGRIFTSAGPARERWPSGETVVIAAATPTFQDLVVLPSGAFRVSGAALTLGDRDIGSLMIGTSLDANYARELSILSAGVAIIVNGEVQELLGRRLA